MMRRVLALAMACLMLSGCGPVRTEPWDNEVAQTDGPEIAYVPLDDRPDNVERVVYLAESLGYTLSMPERDDYRTALDGQPCNENGTQSGDRGELFRWVLDREAAGCDRYVLSMDQLLSGGLVNSRAMYNHEDISLPGAEGGEMAETYSEYELMGLLLSSLAEDADNQVWLLESVMRLAPTVGYQGGTLEDYNALRSYGAQPRPELAGEELVLGTVEESYRLGADGETLDLAVYGLTEAEAGEYLAARGRKLELSHTMMEMVTGLKAENIHVLIGIDDSSEENSIQKNEIAYLRSLLREGDALLSGVDDLAFKAVAKLYLEESGWEGANVSVSYFGGTEDRPACDYDYQSLETIMEEHLAFFGLKEEDVILYADLLVLVLTQPADPEQAETYCRELVEFLKNKQESGIPTILIDASNGSYGTMFHEMLTKEVQLGWLVSYAGFLDMAIVTGTALSHGVARYAFLRSGEQTEATERAFLRTVADSILKDFCYKHIVREDLLAYIRNDLGGDPNNFWLPNIDREAILGRLESGMAAATAPVIRNLERSNFISDLPPNYAERGWGGIALKNYRFPWDRAFEIGVDIQLGEFTEPHERVRGVYYQ